MNRILFIVADFLSRPPGFYWMLGAMLLATVVIPLGVNYNIVTYVLSVLAIIITSVVLIQGYRDTTAIQAKLDELIITTQRARNELVGLEKQEPEKIASEVEKLEEEAGAKRQQEAGKVHARRRPRDET
jgi:low affinity Fe/Cu permease